MYVKVGLSALRYLPDRFTHTSTISCFMGPRSAPVRAGPAALNSIPQAARDWAVYAVLVFERDSQPHDQPPLVCPMLSHPLSSAPCFHTSVPDVYADLDPEVQFWYSDETASLMITPLSSAPYVIITQPWSACQSSTRMQIWTLKCSSGTRTRQPALRPPSSVPFDYSSEPWSACSSGARTRRPHDHPPLFCSLCDHHSILECMQFWHSDETANLMAPLIWSSCDHHSTLECMQFWYSDETASIVAREALGAALGGGIACLACPSLFRQLRAEAPGARTHLLEYDPRFEVGPK